MDDPEELDDSQNPFWVDRQDWKLEPRVRVRYVVPRGLPLWLDDHEELGGLSVARAHGGTVFKVTEAQWSSILALAEGRPAPPQAARSSRIGRPYIHIGVVARRERSDPFSVDPDLIDRGNQAHASTQDALADFLRSHGISPLRPEPGDPEFDLAWEHDGVFYVAEVKSTTPSNEETQLRLGLGQVLRYRSLLAQRRHPVVPVLVPENAPSDQTWLTLCAESSVILVWPETFSLLLSAL